MPTNFTYKKIKAIRSMLMEELLLETGGAMTIDHLHLLEMRVQTVIMAQLDDKEVRSERKKQD